MLVALQFLSTRKLTSLHDPSYPNQQRLSNKTEIEPKKKTGIKHHRNCHLSQESPSTVKLAIEEEEAVLVFEKESKEGT